MSDVVFVPAPRVDTNVNIDPNQPWAAWERPEVWNCDLRDLNVLVLEKDLQLSRNRPDEEPELIGLIDSNGLKQIGGHVGFPADFVAKLPPELQQAIIHDRIQHAPSREFSIVTEGGQFTNMTPGWRELLPYSTTAQFVYDLVRQVYGNKGIEVDEASANGSMHCRITTPLQAPITPKKGDVIQAGVEIFQSYGTTVEVHLYAKRLVCLNGMTSTGSEFKWTQRTAGTIEHQLNWLRAGVNEAIGGFDALVQRSQRMAQTEFRGNPLEVLRETAKAMRLPQSQWGGLVEAYNEEPGQTHWDLLNAITRMATHNEHLPQRTRRAMQRAAGNWAQEFDMVTARLPRPMAVAAGAELIGE